MKKLLLFLLLVSFNLGHAQNLSLSQLISLRTMDLNDAEMFLTQRGWKLKEATKETSTDLPVSVFIYGTNGNFKYAQAFLRKIYSDRNGIHRLSIQIGKKAKYLEYLSTVQSFKPQLIYSGSQNGNLVKIYRGATTIFKFYTSSGINESGTTESGWVLSIFSNDDKEFQY